MSFKYISGLNPNPNFPVEDQVASGSAEALEFQDGWFYNELASREIGLPLYSFVADGITSYAGGGDGFTLATNAPEFVLDSRGNKVYYLTDEYYDWLFKSQELTLSLGDELSKLEGAAANPVTGQPALTQTLSNGIEGFMWDVNPRSDIGGNDIFTLEISGTNPAIRVVQVDMGLGDDVFNIKGSISPLNQLYEGQDINVGGLGYAVANGVLGGDGYDRVNIFANSYEGYYLMRDTEQDSSIRGARWQIQQGDSVFGLTGIEEVAFLDRSFRASDFISPESEVVRSGEFLEGTNSDDYISGGETNNKIDGKGGNDIIYSGAGNDSVVGGTGDDIVIASSGKGNDVYDGSKGYDTVTFLSSSSPIKLDFEKGYAKGADSGKDRLTGIEAVIASNHADKLKGSKKSDHLDGQGGNDTFYATSGKDTVIGGLGFDTVVYKNKQKTYKITKTANGDLTITGKDIGSDYLTDIERLTFGGGLEILISDL